MSVCWRFCLAIQKWEFFCSHWNVKNEEYVHDGGAGMTIAVQILNEYNQLTIVCHFELTIRFNKKSSFEIFIYFWKYVKKWLKKISESLFLFTMFTNVITQIIHLKIECEKNIYKQTVIFVWYYFAIDGVSWVKHNNVLALDYPIKNWMGQIEWQ